MKKYGITLILPIGHIQISQVPDRDEPSDDGTINFTAFFNKVKESGYDGWVAGEYHAAGEKNNQLFPQRLVVIKYFFVLFQESLKMDLVGQSHT